MNHRRRVATLVVAALGMTLLPAASGGAEVYVNPLSGVAAGAGNPVVMVKYGNARPDRPHYGLNQADVIYVEEVEWGITRIAAMFNSRFPSAAGPTRSARISDLEILEQFDSPGLVYSGANDVLLKAVRRSNAVSLSPSERSSFYYRNLSKVAPHNQMVRLAAMMQKEKKLSTAVDIGFVFDRAAPEGGTKAGYWQASWPSSRVSGIWSGNGWVMSFDGAVQRDAATKALLVPKTAIIQFVEQKETKYGDRFGGKTPLVKTVGSGRAIVLRNGRAYDAQWSRPDAKAGTSFTFNGAPLPFDVGQVFVALVNAKGKKNFEVR
ncbi:MAG: DUF3048 domain-containing protein [Ilumatobacteraceae bacterium]